MSPNASYYTPASGSQNQNALDFEAHIDAVIHLKYDEGAMSNGIRDEIIGQDEMDIGNVDTRRGRDIYAHTSLIGAADFYEDDKLNRDYSEANYFTGSMRISGLASMGKKFSYPIEEMEFRPVDRRFVTTMAKDLPRLLQETEEWHGINFWSKNGETTTGGFFGTPIFCDGTTNKLQLLGRPDYFSGIAASNIVSYIGGAGGGMIGIADSYFAQFINEEGLPEHHYVTDVICGQQVGDILLAYYNAKYDLNANLPWVENPRNMTSKTQVIPNIHITNKMTNPTDAIFLGNGWQAHFKRFQYFTNKVDSWVAGADDAPQKRLNVTQTRTFQGFYFMINRLALLIKGAPVN